MGGWIGFFVVEIIAKNQLINTQIITLNSFSGSFSPFAADRPSTTSHLRRSFHCATLQSACEEQGVIHTPQPLTTLCI
jgi:hypothetical protein